MVSVLQEITRNLIPQSSSNEVHKWKKFYVYFSKTELLFEVDFNDNWLSHHNAHKKLCSIIEMHMWIWSFTPTTEFSGKKWHTNKKKVAEKKQTLSKRCQTFFLCKWNFFKLFITSWPCMSLKVFEVPFFEYWRFSQNKELNRIHSANSTLNSIYHHRIINKKSMPKRKNYERCRLFLPRLLALSE